MREIKFRGKRKDNGKWVYGYLIEDCEKSYICWAFPDKRSGGYWQVIPETIGQYTGLKDKNGVEIYEGDIVKWELLGIGKAVVRFGMGEFDLGFYKYLGFYLEDIESGKCVEDDCELHKYETREIIGNIYDNPELLERSDV